MKPELILWPMAIQILLTILLFFPLIKRKKASVAAGTANLKKSALDNSAWPEDVIKVSNNLANQFQIPVLFYVLCLTFYVTNGVSLLVLGLAWVFSLSRIFHAYVHIGSNYIPHRLKSFVLGFLCLLIMTLLLFWHLAQGY